MLALRLRRAFTTPKWPSQAAMWSAVRPSRSMLLTSIPSSISSSTPLTSPLLAMKRSCIVESRLSGTAMCGSSSLLESGLLRIGSREDWRPKLNLMLVRRGSSDDWRVNCRLNVRRIDPVENCLEIPRFSCAAMFSIDDDKASSFFYTDSQKPIKIKLFRGISPHCVFGGLSSMEVKRNQKKKKKTTTTTSQRNKRS